MASRSSGDSGPRILAAGRAHGGIPAGGHEGRVRLRFRGADQRRGAAAETDGHHGLILPLGDVQVPVRILGGPQQ